MKRRAYFLSFLTIGVFILIGGGAFRDIEKSFALDSLEIRKQYDSSPVLTARQSMQTMQTEPGFTIKLVAEEPLINSPVAMVFDPKGRIWVVEMEGYMPDTVGSNEEKPQGRIVILSDANGDGQMDKRTVFLDSLLLPRAICLVANGILVAESPNLWFYEIRDDKPVNKSLVDPTYAVDGNVEHQPNGLFRALDNWIYNAKSDRRYRKQGGKWLIEKTHFRGQWGITQDDYGRLFYNTNSENLIGDVFSPGLGSSNANQTAVSGFNKKIINSNRVYPARATTGVNRGYQPGVLDDSLRLVNFTAACGPVIYSGDLFSRNYYGNAFVAEPSANLIKRNILVNAPNSISGTQAYKNSEFLRSTDERFRPVNLFNGPDGALYIVDMYRGIIQHKTYLTPYLKNEIKLRSLTEPLTFGRIYKVVPTGSRAKNVRFSDDPKKLVKLLGHKNGWVRNMAQQQLVDAGQVSLVTELRKNLKNTRDPLAKIHSLWTIEGLGQLTKDDIWSYLNDPDWTIKMQALTLSRLVINKENYKDFGGLFQQMIASKDSLAAPYIGFLAPAFAPYNAAAKLDILVKLSRTFRNDIHVADAVISSLQNDERSFLTAVAPMVSDTSASIQKRLRKVITEIEKSKIGQVDVAQQFPRGATIFKSFCQVCHGPSGNGVTSLAPPLNNSEWVTGDKDVLSAIVLYGLTGPIQIGNKLYKSPEINGEMPGIAANADFSDADIAQLLNYIRNSWNNKGERIAAKDVNDVRKKFSGRQKPFTAEELKAFAH